MIANEFTIRFAAIGQWMAPPVISSESTGQYTLVHEAADPNWINELCEQAQACEWLTPTELRHLSTATEVIWVEQKIFLDTHRDVHDRLLMAQNGVSALRMLCKEGDVYALFFDESQRVARPEVLQEVDLREATSLLHLFVECWCDEEFAYTEGLSIFACPNIEVEAQYVNDPIAQATAFSAAAQLVCDGLVLTDQSQFRSSESFPYFTCQLSREADMQDEEIINPWGLIRLSRTQKASPQK